MATDAAPRLLLLHVLRLKGFVDTSVVADRSGLDPADAASSLEALAADGLAVHRDGRISGWSLTPAGREAHARLVADDLEAGGCRDAVDGAYRGFLGVNAGMLGVCTDWQIRSDRAPDQVPNDHTDPDYDREVIGRLGEIDDQVQPICADLAVALGRFGDYGPRLATARGRVEAGEVEWFTRPLIDSYHTVWFELHEDLLVTLGIERSAEPVA